MRQLPTGTVTFLFTDVEGSTRLLERLGPRYCDVQERHDDILRAAIAEGEGREVSTEGDSFFAVFPAPAGAVRAAASAQRALAGTAWPDGVDLRVRMGLHTGEGILGGDSYLGLDVNRASRIAAAAHGSQVLLSDATRTMAERSLPPATRLRDLGRHHLKDLTQPEHLYQLVIEGLEQDFPPPRTLDAPTVLPAQLTRFIGRGDETVRVRELLEANRLVTLTGTGGAGKTRLALEVAREAVSEFTGGVFFVDLSSTADAELVPETVAAALHVREEAGRTTIDTLTDHLREKELLLVLDNFEQVVEAAAAVDALLRAAPGVKALVTSRVPLRLHGEQRYDVPPLALPDRRNLPQLDVLTRFDAVALFAERAAAVKPGFRVDEGNARAIAEIAARLDGLPLAIELAASRVRLLSADLLLERLQQRLPLLVASDRNVPERQRTLRGTIEWSHDLLHPSERQLFARLAVFSGGAELEPVEAVANRGGELAVETVDALGALVDSNLVRAVDGSSGEVRFTMLETVREYALERLAQGGEEAEIRRRHAAHWVRVAERSAELLAGPEQAAWTRRLELEHDNFRSALAWALRDREAELGLRLAAALRDFWRLGGHIREGLRWLRELLALPEAAPRALVRARALSAAGQLHAWIDDPHGFLGFAEEALSIYREHDQVREIPGALADLGWAQLQTGDLAAAQATLAQARELTANAGERNVAADCSNGLAIVALLEGRPEGARPFFEEALHAYADVGNTYWVALTELMLSQVDRQEGAFEAADARIRVALAAFGELDSVMGTAWALYSFADVALHRGQADRALRLVGASEALLEQVGEMPALAKATMGDVGEAARSSLDDSTAGRIHAEGLAMGLEEAVSYALR